MNNYMWVIVTLIIMAILIGSGHWIISLIFGIVSAVVWFIRWIYNFGS
jgi:vacuolar-type H+-ATPase subunit I/STV1